MCMRNALDVLLAMTPWAQGTPDARGRKEIHYLHIVIVCHFRIIDDTASVEISDLYEDARATLCFQNVACQILVVEVDAALPVGVLRAYVTGKVFAAQEPAYIHTHQWGFTICQSDKE